MPVLAAVPVAAVLAWLALRANGLKLERRRKRDDGGGDAGGHVGGRGSATGRLEDGEEPFRRDYLDQPSANGGEVGGPYGPAQNEQAPSAPADGYASDPGPTQTGLLTPAGTIDRSAAAAYLGADATIAPSSAGGTISGGGGGGEWITSHTNPTVPATVQPPPAGGVKGPNYAV